MSLKDSWKEAGKDLGKSFTGLGKSIVKAVEIGADKIAGDEEGAEKKTAELKETWKDTADNFDRASDSFGDAVADTGKKVSDELSTEPKTVSNAGEKDIAAEAEEVKPEEPKPEEPEAK